MDIDLDVLQKAAEAVLADQKSAQEEERWSSLPILDAWYSNADPATILSLIAEVRELRKDAQRARQWMPLMGTCLFIPFRLLSENNAQNNHGQSLKRLAERGGLSPGEALAVAKGDKWPGSERPDDLNKLAALKDKSC